MPRFRPLVHLTALLADATKQYLTKSLADAGHAGLEPCHGDVFAVLFAEDCLTLTELARRSGRSKSTVSVMVRRLTTLGYLEKAGDADDSRAVRIRLTPQGKALRPVFDRISKAMQDVLTQGFTGKELSAFEDFLARARENFDRVPS